MMVQSMVPISTRVKHSIWRLAGLAQGHGAGDVGGTVGVLAAAVDEIQATGTCSLALLSAVGAVVNDGPVGRVAADGVEAEVHEALTLGAELAQLVRRRSSLGHAAGGHGLLQPLEELDHGHAIALVGGHETGDLLGVLHGLHAP